ncbi:metallophosphoesterase [Puteibacter caeruleilacunae]|nr:metallophosphoesterase [Puteibacter caeruleilacunae]
MYDIIGDIHGHASLLIQLLEKLGYRENGEGFYAHPERKVIFVGDYINRGTEIRKTLQIIRSMVENNKALAVIGNHEYNAIIYYLKDKNHKYIKKRSAKVKLAMRKTEEQFRGHPDEWKETLKFFRHTPMWLELDGLRIVHAYWNDEHINHLKTIFPDGKLKKKILRSALNDPRTILAIEETLKGLDFKMPFDLVVRDSRGLSHRSFRMRWWESSEGKTFNEAAFGNKFVLPNYTIPKELTNNLDVYKETDPVVIFGHYCLGQGAQVVRPNLCCVDSCITNSGVLTAYRWSGENILSEDNFVSVERE